MKTQAQPSIRAPSAFEKKKKKTRAGIEMFKAEIIMA